MSTFVLVRRMARGSLLNEVIKQLSERTSSVCSHDRRSRRDKNVNHAQCTQSIVDYIVDKDLRYRPTSDIVSVARLLRKLPKRSAIALDDSSS